MSYAAVEGATVLMIGRITYNVLEDEFVMYEALGFVGGGLTECTKFLTSRYEYYQSWGNSFFRIGVLTLAIFGASLFQQMRLKNA